MSTAISTMSAEKMKRLLLKELEALDGGLVLQNVGSGVRIKALWNIARHKLYEADGYQNMKHFAESTGFSYRWVQKLIEQGDIMAQVIFPENTPEELRYLTAEHVKNFVAAKAEAKLLAKGDVLMLESGGKGEAFLTTDDEDVKTIAKKLAKRLKDSKAAGTTGDTDGAPLPPKSAAFIDKYERKRMKVDHLILAAFQGDAEMLAEYNTLSWDEQWPILDAARERILSIPKVG